MSTQYKYYDKSNKNIKYKYVKEKENPPSFTYKCTSRFIKPRTSYDKMIKAFIQGKPIDLPIIENSKTNW